MSFRKPSVPVIVLVVCAVLAGAAAGYLYGRPPHPPGHLTVQLVNASGAQIPSVRIQYANPHLQDELLILGLAKDETRVVVLNHEPGLGYSITARLADDRELEICGGRAKDTWVMREVITPDAIVSTRGR